MKESQYNYFVEWNGMYMGVNLMSGQKIFLRGDQYDRFVASSGRWDTLAKENPELFEWLTKGKFIIEDKIEEFDYLLYRHNRAVFQGDNTFKMTILPTLDCNLRCWYCYEKHIPSKMSEQVMERVVQYVEYILNTCPMFVFELGWFGGEPLLYFDEIMYPLSLKIQKMVKDHHLPFYHQITTNGVLIDEERIQKFKEIQLFHFQITLDGHRYCHDKVRVGEDRQGTYDRILSNINRLCAEMDNLSLTLRINYTNKTLKDVVSIIDDIEFNNRTKVTIAFQRVWQTTDKEQENEDERDCIKSRFEESGFKVLWHTNRYGRGNICYADQKNQSVVNFDGNLFKCTARDFTNTEASIGFLNEKGIPCYKQEYYARYNKVPFENDKCKSCRLVPICLGVCSQKFEEEGYDAIERFCNKTELEKSLKEELYEDMYRYVKQSLEL